MAVLLKQSIRIRDLDRNKEFEVHLGNDDYKQAVATQFGWIVQTRDRFRAYDFDGKYLGCWIDTGPHVVGRYLSLPNRWVRADGATFNVEDSNEVCLVQLIGNQVITVRKETQAWSELPAETMKSLESDPAALDPVHRQDQ